MMMSGRGLAFVGVVALVAMLSTRTTLEAAPVILQFDVTITNGRKKRCQEPFI